MAGGEEVRLGNNKRIVDINTIKGGVKRDQLKNDAQRAIFDALNSVKGKNGEGDELLDAREISAAIEMLLEEDKGDNKLAGSDIGRILDRLGLKGQKFNVDGKERKIKKEDLFEVIELLSQASEDIETSEVIDGENGERTIKITYKNGASQTINDDGSIENQYTDNEGASVTTKQDKDKHYVTQSKVRAGGDTENTEYKTVNGKDVAVKVTTVSDKGKTTTVDERDDNGLRTKLTVDKTGEDLHSVTDFKNGTATKTVSKKGAVEETYEYDKNGKNPKLKHKVENLGNDNTRTTDIEYTENGQIQTIKESGDKTTVRTMQNLQTQDGRSASVAIKEVTTEPDKKTTVVYDYNQGLKQETAEYNNGNITQSIYKMKQNPETGATEYEKSREIMQVGKNTYQVDYENGCTKGVVVQFGENADSIAKKFGCTKKQLIDANPTLKGNFKAGDIINVPGEIGADKAFKGRDTREQAIAKKQRHDAEVEAKRMQQEAAKAQDKQLRKLGLKSYYHGKNKVIEYGGKKYTVIGIKTNRNRLLVRDSEGRIYTASHFATADNPSDTPKILKEEYVRVTDYYDKNVKNPKKVRNVSTSKGQQTYVVAPDEIQAEYIKHPEFKREVVIGYSGDFKCTKGTMDYDYKPNQPSLIEVKDWRDYLSAADKYVEAKVKDGKYEVGNPTYGVNNVITVRSANGTPYYFSASGEHKQQDTEAVRQQSAAAIASDIHEAADGMGTDEEKLHKAIFDGITDSEILKCVNTGLSSLKHKSDDNWHSPLEKVLVDELQVSEIKQEYAPHLINNVMTAEQGGQFVADLINYDLHGGAGITYQVDLDASFSLIKTRDVRIAAEKAMSVHNANHSATAKAGEAQISAALRDDGWKQVEIDRRYAIPMSVVGVYNDDVTEDWNAKAAVLNNLCFNDKNNSDKVNIARGAGVASSSQKFYTEYFLTKADKYNKEHNENEAYVKTQDAGQIFFSNRCADGKGNVDMEDLRYYDAILMNPETLDNSIISQVDAQLAVLSCKQGATLSNCFESLDPEVYANIKAIIADGKEISGCTTIEQLYDKAMDQVDNEVEKVKLRVNAMASGQIAFKKEEIIDECIRLMHIMDSHSRDAEGTYNASRAATGMGSCANSRDEYEVLLTTLLIQHPEIHNDLSTRIDKEQFGFTKRNTISPDSNTNLTISNEEFVATNSKYKDLVDTFYVNDAESVFYDSEGNEITDPDIKGYIREQNMKALDGYRKYVASLRREHLLTRSGEAWMEDFGNIIAEARQSGTDRGDVANEYGRAANMYRQLALAANGQLRDKAGKVISFDELARGFEEEENKLSGMNTEYQNTAAQGKTYVVLGGVIIVTTAATLGTTALLETAGGAALGLSSLAEGAKDAYALTALGRGAVAATAALVAGGTELGLNMWNDASSVAGVTPEKTGEHFRSATNTAAITLATMGIGTGMGSAEGKIIQALTKAGASKAALFGVRVLGEVTAIGAEGTAMNLSTSLITGQEAGAEAYWMTGAFHVVGWIPRMFTRAMAIQKDKSIDIHKESIIPGEKPTKIYEEEGLVVQEFGEGNVKSKIYADANGNPVHEVHTDGKGNVIERVYSGNDAVSEFYSDANGLVKEVHTDGKGNTIERTHNADGTTTEVRTDANGHVETIAKDAEGNIIPESQQPVESKAPETHDALEPLQPARNENSSVPESPNALERQGAPETHNAPEASEPVVTVEQKFEELADNMPNINNIDELMAQAKKANLAYSDVLKDGNGSFTYLKDDVLYTIHYEEGKPLALEIEQSGQSACFKFDALGKRIRITENELEALKTRSTGKTADAVTARSTNDEVHPVDENSAVEVSKTDDVVEKVHATDEVSVSDDAVEIGTSENEQRLQELADDIDVNDMFEMEDRVARDPMGRNAIEYDGRGPSGEIIYTENGVKYRIEYKQGEAVAMKIEGEGNALHFKFDENGNKVPVTSDEFIKLHGEATDAYLQVQETKGFRSVNLTTGETDVTEFRTNSKGETTLIIERTLDEYGNEVRIVHKNPKGKVKNISEIEYNADNKPIHVVFKNGKDKVIGSREFEYNAFGKETKMVSKDRKGNIKNIEEREYDAFGNEIKRVYKDGKGNIERIIEREYDGFDNEIKIVYKDGKGNIKNITEKEYDTFNNNTKVVSKDSKGNIERIIEREYDGSKLVRQVSIKIKKGKVASATLEYSADEFIAKPRDITAEYVSKHAQDIANQVSESEMPAQQRSTWQSFKTQLANVGKMSVDELKTLGNKLVQFTKTQTKAVQAQIKPILDDLKNLIGIKSKAQVKYKMNYPEATVEEFNTAIQDAKAIIEDLESSAVRHSADGVEYYDAQGNTLFSKEVIVDSENGMTWETYTAQDGTRIVRTKANGSDNYVYRNIELKDEAGNPFLRIFEDESNPGTYLKKEATDAGYFSNGNREIPFSEGDSFSFKDMSDPNVLIRQSLEKSGYRNTHTYLNESYDSVTLYKENQTFEVIYEKLPGGEKRPVAMYSEAEGGKHWWRFESDGTRTAIRMRDFNDIYKYPDIILDGTQYPGLPIAPDVEVMPVESVISFGEGKPSIKFEDLSDTKALKEIFKKQKFDCQDNLSSDGTMLFTHRYGENGIEQYEVFFENGEPIGLWKRSGHDSSFYEFKNGKLEYLGNEETCFTHIKSRANDAAKSAEPVVQSAENPPRTDNSSAQASTNATKLEDMTNEELLSRYESFGNDFEGKSEIMLILNKRGYRIHKSYNNQLVLIKDSPASNPRPSQSARQNSTPARGGTPHQPYESAPKTQSEITSPIDVEDISIAQNNGAGGYFTVISSKNSGINTVFEPTVSGIGMVSERGYVKNVVYNSETNTTLIYIQTSQLNFTQGLPKGAYKTTGNRPGNIGINIKGKISEEDAIKMVDYLVKCEENKLYVNNVLNTNPGLRENIANYVNEHIVNGGKSKQAPATVKPQGQQGLTGTDNPNIQKARTTNPSDLATGKVREQWQQHDLHTGAPEERVDLFNLDQNAGLSEPAPVIHNEVTDLVFKGKLNEHLTQRYEKIGQKFENIAKSEKVTKEIQKLVQQHPNDREAVANGISNIIRRELRMQEGLEPPVVFGKVDGAKGAADWVNGRIVIDPSVTNVAELTEIISHEYVHMMQFRDIAVQYGPQGIKEMIIGSNPKMTPAQQQASIDTALNNPYNKRLIADGKKYQSGSVDDYLSSIYNDEFKNYKGVDDAGYTGQLTEVEAYHLGSEKAGNNTTGLNDLTVDGTTTQHAVSSNAIKGQTAEHSTVPILSEGDKSKIACYVKSKHVNAIEEFLNRIKGGDVPCREMVFELAQELKLDGKALLSDIKNLGAKKILDFEKLEKLLLNGKRTSINPNDPDLVAFKNRRKLTSNEEIQAAKEAKAAAQQAQKEQEMLEAQKLEEQKNAKASEEAKNASEKAAQKAAEKAAEEQRITRVNDEIKVMQEKYPEAELNLHDDPDLTLAAYQLFDKYGKLKSDGSFVFDDMAIKRDIRQSGINILEDVDRTFLAIRDKHFPEQIEYARLQKEYKFVDPNGRYGQQGALEIRDDVVAKIKELHEEGQSIDLDIILSEHEFYDFRDKAKVKESILADETLLYLFK